MIDRTPLDLPCKTCKGTGHQHGRGAGYEAGCRCEPCAQYRQSRKLEWQAEVKAKRPEQIPHGTGTGYSSYGCHCPLCRRAHADYVTARNRARR